MSGAASTTVKSTVPLSIKRTLAPNRRGPGDPTYATPPDGSVWRTSVMPTGPVTCRLQQRGDTEVHCEAWGPGAAEFLSTVPSLVGALDDPSGFAPEHRILQEAHRRLPNLRIGATGRVMEALFPAILEQKVHGIAAFASFARLVRRFGEPAPGPAPAGMRTQPTAEVLRRVPSWEFHRANVDPKRARAIVSAASVAPRLEEAAAMTGTAARARLEVVPGIGVWTSAEVAQRAFGDPDALSVGDYHLASMLGWTLRGRPMNDDEMVAYMEPLRPHRYRAVRLIEVSGTAVRPRFGPRTQITDHRSR